MCLTILLITKCHCTLNFSLQLPPPNSTPTMKSIMHLFHNVNTKCWSNNTRTKCNTFTCLWWWWWWRAATTTPTPTPTTTTTTTTTTTPIASFSFCWTFCWHFNFDLKYNMNQVQYTASCTCELCSTMSSVDIPVSGTPSGYPTAIHMYPNIEKKSRAVAKWPNTPSQG